MTTSPRIARLTGAGLDLTFTNVEDDRLPTEQILTSLSGWFGGVGVSGETEQRTLGHGYFPQAARRTGRSLTLEGIITFEREEDRNVADRFLSGVLWDGEFGDLTVTVDTLTLSTSVRLDGEIAHEYLGTPGSPALRVQIPLVAPSPFLLGEAKTFSVYPVGAGVGLEWPLFKGGRAVALNPNFDSTGVETIVGPEGQTGLSTNRTLVNSARWAIPVKPGVTYRQTVWARADKAGSHACIRTTRVNGTMSSPYLFWPKPVPTEWTKYSDTIVADGGSVTDFRLDLWTNHSGGEVRDARQDIVVLLEEIPAVLSFGTANPDTRIAVSNEGNATGYPTIVVKGDLPGGFRLRAGSKTIEYPWPVWQEAPVTIECAKGVAYVSGMDQTFRLTRRDFFELAAYGGLATITLQSLSPGDGWADVTVRDTYI